MGQIVKQDKVNTQKNSNVRPENENLCRKATNARKFKNENFTDSNNYSKYSWVSLEVIIK